MAGGGVVVILSGCIGGNKVEENAIFCFSLLLGPNEGFNLLPGIVFGGMTMGGGVGVTNTEGLYPGRSSPYRSLSGSYGGNSSLRNVGAYVTGDGAE